jgi:hypothetical protein
MHDDAAALSSKSRGLNNAGTIQLIAHLKLKCLSIRHQSVELISYSTYHNNKRTN